MVTYRSLFFAFSVFFFKFYSVFRFQHGSVWSKIFRVTFYGLRTVASTTKEEDRSKCSHLYLFDYCWYTMYTVCLFFCTFARLNEQLKTNLKKTSLIVFIWLSIYTVWGCSNNCQTPFHQNSIDDMTLRTQHRFKSYMNLSFVDDFLFFIYFH